jgi:hypothetical protein
MTALVSAAAVLIVTTVGLAAALITALAVLDRRLAHHH